MNNYEYKKLHPFKWFVLQNFPFIEADFDAITEYQLLCKIVEYLNKTINSVNNIGENQEQLSNAFIELKNYVDNFFSDLNVQEQINNKLDAMAESGELAEIINEQIFSELNEAINTNTTNIETLQNRKIVNYLASKYDTLQEAINDAYSHNDVVYLDENIEINEPQNRIDVKCSLIGLANAKINCSFLNIVEPNVTIENIEITAVSDRIINIKSDDSVVKDNIKINNCKLFLNNAITTLPYSIVYNSHNISINNLQITNNYIKNAGIQLTKCTNFNISNNYIDGLMNNLSENELIHTSYKSSGIISDNTLCNNVYDFIDIFSAGEKTIISNNRMYNGKMNGIECKVVLKDNEGSSNTNGFVENCIITDNIISDLNAEDNGEYAGILAVMYDVRTNKTPVATENDVPKNLIISNNIIRDININTRAKYCGIKTSANNSIISNNIIQNLHNGDTQTAGIYLYTKYSTPTETQIQNNRFKGCYPYGVYLQYVRNCLINGNVFQRDSEGNNNNYGNRYGVGIENGYGVTIANNIFKWNSESGVIQTDGSNLLNNINLSNNEFYQSSVLFNNIINLSITNNMFSQSHATGQPSLKIDSPLARRLVNIIGNNFYNLGSAMAINIKNMEFMNINDNIFSNCSYPIYLQNNSRKINIHDNISYNTLNTDFVYFGNVSSEDQATISQLNNIDDK